MISVCRLDPSLHKVYVAKRYRTIAGLTHCKDGDILIHCVGGIYEKKSAFDGVIVRTMEED